MHAPPHLQIEPDAAARLLRTALRSARSNRLKAHALLAVATAALLAAGCGASERATAPVDPAVLDDTSDGGAARFLVFLREQGKTEGLDSRDGRAIVSALRAVAGSSQTDVQRTLDQLRADYRAYWVVNAFAVTGDRAVVETLAQLPAVAKIESDRAFEGPLVTHARAATGKAAAAGWNIEKIGAPALWSMGITGQGVVYANADSGVTWQHPALRPHYRGWNGSTGVHDYNWWDAVHADLDGDGTNPCGFNTKAPCDDDTGNSHGSHTIGTAIGDDGAGNQIGVAPGAKWISCRNMDSGIGRPSTYIECLQFFLAPTDLQGSNPDPARRPDVVGNSYACPTNEQCTQDSLRVAVDNMRAAGIFMSVSAGNEGPNCSSVVWPPSHYDSSVSVGATDIDDAIAGFSSRGPVTIDGSGRPKPDLVAPGVGVRSSTRTGYGALSGTSMASPHVGGAVALLWSALPNLRRDVDATERLLEQTAVQRTSTQGCGGNTAAAVPNNVFGYGRIDVLAAYRAAAGQNARPAVTIEDVRVAEGTGSRTPATFSVTLAPAPTTQASVAYTTVDGTAHAGSDYEAANGTIAFAPGERSKSVVVQVIGDAAVEPDETFVLRLSSPVNATLARGEATATITNDDVARDRTAPRLSRLRVSGRMLRFALSENAKATVAIKRGRKTFGTIRRSLRPGAASIRLPALAPGRYVAAISVRDAAGNVGRASRAFTVKKG